MDENRQPVILDCDPGIDDAVALLLAARAPELKLVAVTAVAGNVGLDKMPAGSSLWPGWRCRFSPVPAVPCLGSR